ncbi:hypothetical protein J4E83_008813 [Alternaria metachromatica]|uniref:uncharacterized protein n=1 Tax=Alternaria metachromatica TaxID=283354 RepID=UPI0020C2F0BE|nr:uncharacterized protein J4E83_008813 [Alternaria metachromatica]KAI4609171.1 hypothetical protein J4E83_008813 [Alternaria metachromatica]
MQLTLLLAPLLAASALAAPTEISTRQTRTLRVQLSNDATDAAVQANIPANGMRISIRANFGNLGSPIRANRALIVGSGSGSCSIFSDAAATRRIATIVPGGADAEFGNTNLDNGVIICQ